MADTAREETRRRESSARNFDDEDETLREVGDEHDFADDEEEGDAADRRRDPLRIPH